MQTTLSCGMHSLQNPWGSSRDLRWVWGGAGGVGCGEVLGVLGVGRCRGVLGVGKCRGFWVWGGAGGVGCGEVLVVCDCEWSLVVKPQSGCAPP